MTTKTHQNKHLNYRPDIDGLRAIAVLAVVIFHASPLNLKGGFIGVDIFFVISGYLITSILLKDLHQGRFSVLDFYIRRANRIFPALILMLLTVFGLGWFALLPDEYAQLGKYMAAGAGFVANLALWRDLGYFDTASDLKPLLHLWSLGVEEQFYFVWPLALWLGFKRRWNLLTLTILVSLASYYASLRGGQNRCQRRILFAAYAILGAFGWCVCRRLSCARNQKCTRFGTKLVKKVGHKFGRLFTQYFLCGRHAKSAISCFKIRRFGLGFGADCAGVAEIDFGFGFSWQKCLVANGWRGFVDCGWARRLGQSRDIVQ
jgi:peptidoglycan/LPS O-acetylase OafA/YrhL